VKEILAHFDRAYIINLSDRVDRRREIIREFARIGFDIPTSKIQFYTAKRPKEQGAFPTLGSRGCFTSHRDVLDLALKDKLQNVLVFEDDVAFAKIDPVTIRQIAQELEKKDWNVVYFGYLKPAVKFTGDRLVLSRDGVMGGHFYGVNGNFIATMARYMHDCETRPAGHPLGGPMFRDGAYNHVRTIVPDLRVFLAVPNLATQRSSRTDLHAVTIFDSNRFLRPIASVFRGLKNRIAERFR
jgi:glycosyl transferase, family 25